MSHSLHFVRHEGRLATISRTRLTRSMAAVESEFYPPAAELVVIIAESFNQDGRLMLTSCTVPPRCAQDDGGT